MQELVAPQGLVADLITPLTQDRAIDRSGLQKLLGHVASSVQAVFLAGPRGGEGRSLTLAQRLALLEEACDVIQSRIPIFVWITQDSEEETRKAVFALRGALKTDGYAGDVFWVDTPLYYHSNRGLPDHYKDICSQTSEPLILHNDPELVKEVARPLKRSNIRTAVLKEVAALSSLVGLIFHGSLDRVHNYHRACRRRPHFRIYDGDEDQFLDHPSMSGAVSLGANLAPKTWQKVTLSSLQLKDGQQEYPDHLRQLWEGGRYLRNLRNIYRDKPVAIVKRALSDLGIISSPTCVHSTENMAGPSRQIREVMEHYKGQGAE